jgi:hypothetical protein
MDPHRRILQINLIAAAGDEIRPFAQAAQEAAEAEALARGCLPCNAKSIGADAGRSESNRRYAEIKKTWPADIREDLDVC